MESMRKTLSVGAAGVPEVLRGIVTSMISKTATSVKKAVMSKAVMGNSFSLITQHCLRVWLSRRMSVERTLL
jgi:hypothetical protein